MYENSRLHDALIAFKAANRSCGAIYESAAREGDVGEVLIIMPFVYVSQLIINYHYIRIGETNKFIRKVIEEQSELTKKLKSPNELSLSDNLT